MVDRVVFVGVDTHADVHHAAMVDELGRWLGDRGFATTPLSQRVELSGQLQISTRPR
jgi:hypothetical protein